MGDIFHSLRHGSDGSRQRQRSPQHAIVPQLRRDHIETSLGPIRHLAAEFRPEGREQVVAGLGDAAADDDTRRIQQHDRGLQTLREIHNVTRDERRIEHQFAGWLAVVALQP